MTSFDLVPKTRWHLLTACGLATLVAVGCGRSQPEDLPWPSYGGGPENSRYIVADQITPANVSELEVAWTYPYSETEFNPVVVHGMVFGRGRDGAIVALDAKTGEEIWVREGMSGMTRRGMNYWESADGTDRRLIFAMQDYLQELDAMTGEIVRSFGTDGVVDLRLGLGRDPETIGRIMSNTPGEIFEDLILIGSATGEGYMSPPGDVRAYNVVTGDLAWQFHTIPHPGEFGYETWPPEAYEYIGGVNTWGELSIDTELGIAYFPTGSPTYDYYGADRIGANLFSTSLVALDARTGERRWHFQAVHHDLWDFDNSAAPQLTTIRHEGRSVDVVAMAGKTGFLYVFDRETGEPIWPIEERAVARSDMPGEESWPTQPYPTNPPPFAAQSFTVDDVNPYGNVTTEARARLIERLKAANNVGLFTPINFNDTVHVPGSNGGALFGTASSEPDTGIVYVVTQDNPAVLRLLRPGEGRGGPSTPAGQVVYQRECQVCHGPSRAGTDNGPALTDVGARLDQSAIREHVLTGGGRMAAFTHLTNADLEAVVSWLVAPEGRGRGAGPGARGAGPAAQLEETEPALPPGPVVGSGGAATRPARGRGAPRPYPEGVPQFERYTINEYGTVTSLHKPPYTTIVKYDLNKPAIEWRVGLGDDPRLAAEGITGTGMPQMRNSILVTSTGLIFGPGNDNKIRAYSTENGEILWTSSYAGTFRGSPVVYVLDGRQYLLVAAAGHQNRQGNQDAPYGDPEGPLGYVAYALPQ